LTLLTEEPLSKAAKNIDIQARNPEVSDIFARSIPGGISR
jgi:hypothetical protein